MHLICRNVSIVREEDREKEKNDILVDSNKNIQKTTRIEFERRGLRRKSESSHMIEDFCFRELKYIRVI